MPHFRKRHLTELLVQSLSFSPLVGVLGHRQVGKTTLVEKMAGGYVTLDHKDCRHAAQENPRRFIAENLAEPPLVIDECQKAPDLFDELKEWVRTRKKPGQFLLTGSVRFTSKKAIRESLTGRIVYHELLPFTVSEIEHRPLSQVVRGLIQAKDVASWVLAFSRNLSPSRGLKKTVESYQELGGLPGCFFIRNEKLRRQKIAEQLQTILDRDLRELVSTRLSFSQILEFTESLALQEGRPVSYSEILKETGVSTASAKKIIAALEASFLIRQMKVEGGRKGWIFFFEDHAESLYLSSGKLDPSIYRAGFLYRNIRAEFFYDNEHPFRFFHYLTKHNTTLPFAVEWGGKIMGFLPLTDPEPSHGELMAAQSFLKRYDQAKVLMLHPEGEARVVSDRIVALADWMLF